LAAEGLELNPSVTWQCHSEWHVVELVVTGLGRRSLGRRAKSPKAVALFSQGGAKTLQDERPGVSSDWPLKTELRHSEIAAERRLLRERSLDGFPDCAAANA